MNYNRRIRWSYAGVCVALLTAASPGFATDWPITRQNMHRTGAPTGEGILETPAVQGRVYLGGSLSTSSMFAADINDDGYTEIAMVVGGKVLLKDLQDRVLWDTRSIQAASIMGAYDFDGDSATDLLVLGFDGLYILRGRDGDVLWHKTNFAANNNETNISNTRILDVTGDGLPDIVTKAFWWSDGLVHAYGFGAGFDPLYPDENELWSHTITGYNGGHFPAVGDTNNDGVAEVVSSNAAQLEVYSTVTGATVRVYNTDHSLYFCLLYTSDAADE